MGPPAPKSGAIRMTRRNGIQQFSHPSLRSAHTLCGLLQKCDLSRVIEFVLRDAVQHVIKIVSLAGDAVSQTIFRKSRNGLDQLFMGSLGGCDGLAPCGFRGLRWN